MVNYINECREKKIITVSFTGIAAVLRIRDVYHGFRIMKFFHLETQILHRKKGVPVKKPTDFPCIFKLLTY
jgi:hypothetical protein